ASIGMAMYPEDGTTAELLLKHADSALYQAKAEGRNGYTRFSKASAKNQNAILFWIHCSTEPWNGRNSSCTTSLNSIQPAIA
ncbi:MAG: diguanylate cyclase, partial [Synechococcales cyanobacterium RU_4_20]|nr:diguanylate cyclase [Synechococcales cyanobacterium RU_4_20]